MAAWTQSAGVTIHVACRAAFAGIINQYIRDGFDFAQGIEGLARLLHAAAHGTEDARVFVAVHAGNNESGSPLAATQATGSFSVDTYGSVSAGDTFTLGSAVFTIVAAGTATGFNQVDIGSSADELVTNMAAAINNHPRLRGIVTAAADTGDDDVDLTAVDGGPHANLIHLADTSSGISGSGDYMTGGAPNSDVGALQNAPARGFFNGSIGGV